MDRIELFDGGYLYFDMGRFDNFCVYQMNKDGIRYAPRDIDYFNDLYEYVSKYYKDNLYNDFVKIYDLTTNRIEENVVKIIREISIEYDEDGDNIFRIFSTIYMGMIAEENKKNTKLGKKIKRLGIYYLLVKLRTPEYCSNFMKNMNWREIDRLCNESGFWLNNNIYLRINL